MIPLSSGDREISERIAEISHWEAWSKRAALPDLARPGVYALAISPTEIGATLFSWRPEIVYIGTTNAKGGLKSRLQQFENTIKGREGHGGGRRFRFKHSDYARLTSTTRKSPRKGESREQVQRLVPTRFALLVTNQRRFKFDKRRQFFIRAHDILADL